MSKTLYIARQFQLHHVSRNKLDVSRKNTRSKNFNWVTSGTELVIMGSVHAFARESAVLDKVPIFLGDENADWSVGVVAEAIQSSKEESLPLKRPYFFPVIAGAEHEELPETLQRGRPFRSHETHDP